MAVTVYRSTDASAPSLTGTAGSMITVLTACLVSGYGTQLSSGWTVPYTGASLASYRAATGNRRWLHVNDASATDTRMIGYEDMTAVTTGTGMFPTTAQLSGGTFVNKGIAGAVARPWIIVATGSCFYLFLDGTLAAGTDLTATVAGQSFMFFGDFISNRPGDQYNTALISPRLVAGAGATSTFPMLCNPSAYTANGGHWMARAYTQIGASTTFGKATRAGIVSSSFTIGAGGGDFPDPITGNMNLSYVDIIEQTGGTATQVSRRGRFPGLWAPLHTLPGTSMDTFNGAGDLAGKTFMLINGFYASTPGRFAIEISDTW